MKCTVTPRNPLIFLSEQISTVTDTICALLNTVFSFMHRFAARFSTFEANVQRPRHTEVYFWSTTERKCRKLLFSTIDRGRLQSITKSDSIELVIFLLRVTSTVLPNTGFHEL